MTKEPKDARRASMDHSNAREVRESLINISFWPSLFNGNISAWLQMNIVSSEKKKNVISCFSLGYLEDENSKEWSEDSFWTWESTENSDALQVCKSQFQVNRKPPLVGWRKSNTDGSAKTNPREMSAGGLIQGEDGRWVTGFSMQLGHWDHVVIWTGKSEARIHLGLEWRNSSSGSECCWFFRSSSSDDFKVLLWNIFFWQIWYSIVGLYWQQ